MLSTYTLLGMYTMRMLDQNSTSNNSSAMSNVSSIPHLGLSQNPMQTNISGLGLATGGSSAGSHTHPHTTHTGDRLDASSDSAVSSMGSERVASLSDGEWGEGGSDSAQDYHHTKFGGPYDYRYNNSRMMDANRPIAQKKHQMFGKRFAHEPPHTSLHQMPSELPTTIPNIPNLPSNIPNIPIKYEPYEPYSVASSLEGAVGPAVAKVDSEMKYSYSLDFPRHAKSGSSSAGQFSGSHHSLIHHNHSYTLPQHTSSGGATPRPQQRDKKNRKQEDEHLTRDEKRARSLHVPIPVLDIINLPMDEFNERLSKYDLSENQLSLIRDIRRRGKNKVAAQNCRKRKLDQILSLADEVKEMKGRKERLLRERDIVMTERRRVKDKFAALYRHVFQNLRDPEGNQYSSYQYSLQQSADGSVILVPRSESDQNGASSSRGNNGQGPTGPNNQRNFK